jgi:8-hydroxy-5-deazaflavin:NADPH oxidoreductase
MVGMTAEDDHKERPLLTIAVLGAGVVGRTLAAGWVRAGHRLLLGSRDPDSPRMAAAVADTGAASAAHPVVAARAADVVVITVPGDQVEDLVGDLGDALAGRIAVDTTNNSTPGAPVLHHVDELTRAGAIAFRAFNTTGWEQMADPTFGALRCDLPYAGPDTADRATVERLAAGLGFRPVWLGDGPDALALTDALARLWFQLAFTRGWGRRLGLRLLSSADDRDLTSPDTPRGTP